MGKMRITLYPKEEMRTPRICLFFWNQQNRMAGHNQFRQFMLAHYPRKINGMVPPAPLCSSFDGDDPEPCGVTECMTEEYCIAMVKQEGIDNYRQDCNIDSLPYWNADDTPDRFGVDVKCVTEYQKAGGSILFLIGLMRYAWHSVLFDS
jgi:hypothetical protein